MSVKTVMGGTVALVVAVGAAFYLFDPTSKDRGRGRNEVVITVKFEPPVRQREVRIMLAANGGPFYGEDTRESPWSETRGFPGGTAVSVTATQSEDLHLTCTISSRNGTDGPNPAKKIPGGYGCIATAVA